MATFHTVNQRGQVTIPIDIRRELGLKAGDKVGFLPKQVEFGTKQFQYVLIREDDIVGRTAGCFAKYQLDRPLTIEEEHEAFQQGVADEVMASMRESE